MLKVLYDVIKDFGALGVGIAQFMVIGYFGWKLFSNHLKHLQNGINILDKKTDKIEEKLQEQGNRISKIEGKLS